MLVAFKPHCNGLPMERAKGLVQLWRTERCRRKLCQACGPCMPGRNGRSKRKLCLACGPCTPETCHRPWQCVSGATSLRHAGTQTLEDLLSRRSMKDGGKESHTAAAG